MTASRIWSVLVVAAVVGIGGAGGVVDPPAAAAHEYALGAEPPNVEELEEALDRVPAGVPPREAAEALFPGDSAAQREYLRIVEEIDGERSGGTRAVPVLAVFVPVLTKCVISGFSGAAIAEGVNLARNGKLLAVEGAVDAAIGGCIAGVLPKPLMALAEASKRPLVTAIAAVIVRFSPLDG